MWAKSRVLHEHGDREEDHARCFFATSSFGRPSMTSEGRYRRCFPHNWQVTSMEWNGNSLAPEGTSR